MTPTITVTPVGAPGSFTRRVQKNPQIAVNLLRAVENAADTFRDAGHAFVFFQKFQAAEAMAIAETAMRLTIELAKGGGQ